MKKKEKFLHYTKYFINYIYSMRTLLIAILVISWILFVWSVLLMTPKGWLGAWIAGMWGSSDYGSKKNVENTLKRIALITAIIFVAAAAMLPYTQ